MKDVLCVVCCVMLCLVLCSCMAAPAETPQTTRSTTTSIITTTTSFGGTSATEQTTTSDIPTTVTTTRRNPTTTHRPTTTVLPTTEQTSTITPTNPTKNPLKPFTYTVKDPDNKRGLSTKKYGFSFGVGQNGEPPAQSVANQHTFDGFDNVSALALDLQTDQKVMYLTFDNGYEYHNLTADILDTLKQKNVKAAFFVTLSYVKGNKALVKRMIDEGHIVGNHSTTHPSFPKLTRTQMAKEIAQLDNYLREHFSYTSPYFRFPAGEYSENALELVTSLGYHGVFWSLAHADWDTSTQQGAKHAYDTVTSRFHSGAVILLHAVSQDNAQALGDIIDTAIDEGYTFDTLDEYFQ